MVARSSSPESVNVPTSPHSSTASSERRATVCSIAHAECELQVAINVAADADHLPAS
jgi:hypothetical protein